MEYVYLVLVINGYCILQSFFYIWFDKYDTAFNKNITFDNV